METPFLRPWLALLLAAALGSGTSGVDLVADVTAVPNPSVAGTWVDLEASIRNDGSMPAHGVRAELEVAGDRVMNADPARGCSTVGSVRVERSGTRAVEPWSVSCRRAMLDPGDTLRLQAAIRVETVGYGAVRVGATSLEVDLRPEDNVAELTLISQ